MNPLLSPLGNQLLAHNAANAYRRLVVTGDGDASARAMLQTATPDKVLALPVARSDEASAVMAGLWLWHDWLDESHTLSQGVQSATGSYWHAIMHRREGDFSNAKYWFAKCRRHAVMQTLAGRAAEIVRASPQAGKLGAVLSGGWDPDALVDLAEELHERPADPRADAVVMLQQAEWQALFDLTVRGASGGDKVTR